MIKINNIYLLNDHKTGFNLSNKTISIINKYSKKKIISRTFFLFWNYYHENNKYIVLIRNPKEIICSGYLYHKKCKENWAVEKNGDYYSYWKERHFTKGSLIKNKNFLHFAKSFSNPIPYQEKLNNISEEEGIIKEMNCVAYLTIRGMYNLNHYYKKNVYILKYEDLVFNHNETIKKLCEFIGIDDSLINDIIDLSIKNNLMYQKNESKLTDHCTNINLCENRYKKFWNNRIDKEFFKLFPKDIMEKLKYND